MTATVPGVTLRHVDVGEVRLHVAEAGSGPLVVLLHGFPEFWFSWRHQIPYLVEHGYRVVAPDMRGYNLSDKPRGTRHYRLERLTADVDGLIRACGDERAIVVGHDWGAAVAWAFAMAYPQRVSRLAIVNVPHPARFLSGLWRPSQLLKSWYIFFFQLPAIPEMAFRAANYRALRRAYSTVNRDAFTPDEVEEYVKAFSRPGALTAAINYYRALLQRSPLSAPRMLRRIEAPVKVIWGMQDVALGPHLAEPPRQWVPHYTITRIPNASHWVQNDVPDHVNELLLAFISGREGEE
jgi:pimeloyl-ACP methyl ester carboxylesterase